MRIFIIVLADLFVLVTAVMAAYELFGLKRFNSFTVPYTDKMVKLRIIDKNKRDSLLSEEKNTHIIGVGLAIICAAMISWFIAKWTGAVVFVLAFGGLVFFLHPDMEETPATRAGYFKAHHAVMDIKKYHDFLVSVGDASADDSIL